MAETVDKTGVARLAHKGFDTFRDAMSLQLQMYVQMAAVILLVQGLVVSGLCFVFTDATQRSVTGAYYYAKVSRTMFSNPAVSFVINDKDFTLPANQVVKTPTIKKVAQGQTAKLISIWLLSFALWLVLPLAVRYFKRKAEKDMAKEHIRGPQLLTSDQLLSEIEEAEAKASEVAKKEGKVAQLKPRFFIGRIPIPVRYETHNVFLVGKPGVGKSVLSYQFLEKMRGHKAIILDVKGEYTSKFYNPERGDKIFNILDSRSVKWNIFKDFHTEFDIEGHWHSQVPDAKSGGNEQFFNDAGRAVGIGVTYACRQMGKPFPSAMYGLISGSLEALEETLRNCEAASQGHAFIEQPKSPMAGSVKAVLMQYAAWMRYLPDDGDWSLNEWLNDGKEGFLFVGTKKDVAKILQPALSLFIDLAARKILSFPDDPNRRIYFLIDELGALNRMNILPTMLTEGRSKGLSLLMAIQDVSQLIEKYGEHLTRTILNSIGTVGVFNLPDDYTAKLLEKRFGDTQFRELEESQTLGVKNNASLNHKKDKRTEPLVMASEIQSLKELEFYVRIPNFNPAKSKLDFLPINNTPVSHPDFILRPEFILAPAGVTSEDKPTFSDPFAALESSKHDTGENGQDEPNSVGGLQFDQNAMQTKAKGQTSQHEVKEEEFEKKAEDKEDLILEHENVASFEIEGPSF